MFCKRNAITFDDTFSAYMVLIFFFPTWFNLFENFVFLLCELIEILICQRERMCIFIFKMSVNTWTDRTIMEYKNWHANRVIKLNFSLKMQQCRKKKKSWKFVLTTELFPRLQIHFENAHLTSERLRQGGCDTIKEKKKKNYTQEIRRRNKLGNKWKATTVCKEFRIL